MKKLNIQKLERIQRSGQEADLPLFGGAGEDPTWLPNHGNDTKSESHKQMQNHEALVLSIIRRIGPCTDQEIAEELQWDINQVTGRRNSLLKKNRVERCGTVPGPHGRRRALWKAN